MKTGSRRGQLAVIQFLDTITRRLIVTPPPPVYTKRGRSLLAADLQLDGGKVPLEKALQALAIFFKDTKKMDLYTVIEALLTYAGLDAVESLEHYLRGYEDAGMKLPYIPFAFCYDTRQDEDEDGAAK